MLLGEVAGANALGLFHVRQNVVSLVGLACHLSDALTWSQFAQVWIAIFSFVGNYFWTHYFFQLLGAAYTFPSWRLNDVRPLLDPSYAAGLAL